MNDYLIGSQILGADPRTVKEISFASNEFIVGDDSIAVIEAQLKAQDKSDTKKANLTLAGMVAGAIVGTVAGAKIMKSSPVLGALIGLVSGAFVSSAGTAYIVNKKVGV